MNSEQISKQHYNILTSSDSILIPQIAVSITAMAKNLEHDFIDFYFLHSRVKPEEIEMLSVLCNGYGNISFHEIKVPNPEAYDPLVQAGGWVKETYYPLCAHQLLPDNLDRILYLDAGDTLIVGDIAPYYTCDFENNFLIVTGQTYKKVNDKFALFTSDDLTDQPSFIPGVLKGLFNSGSYMINLKKMREANINISFYTSLTKQLQNSKITINEENSVYFGDQGLLSIAFIGRLKYYGYPQIDNKWYVPYNFFIGYFDHFDQKPDYQPAILHFAGVPFKPWVANYPVFPNRYQRTGGMLRELSELKPLQIEYYFLWLEYFYLTDKVLSMLGY